MPGVPNMGSFVSKEMIQKYYDDECAAMLAPKPKPARGSWRGLQVPFADRPIAETIVERATHAGSNMIYMGTRGMSALPNMAQ